MARQNSSLCILPVTKFIRPSPLIKGRQTWMGNKLLKEAYTVHALLHDSYFKNIVTVQTVSKRNAQQKESNTKWILTLRRLTTYIYDVPHR
jgi:hypothetical protein